MDMQSILDGREKTFAITNHIPPMCVLFERGYNRVNKNLTSQNYPQPQNGNGFARTVSKSGMVYRRIMHFSQPYRRFEKFNDIYTAGEFWRTDTATLHDGMEFVAREFPYLRQGEIVIGFPGMLRQNCSESYVPLLIISPKEVSWDEAPTSVGWEAHWWRAGIFK